MVAPLKFFNPGFVSSTARRGGLAVRLAVWGVALGLAAAPADTVWQPVTNYSISFPGDHPDAAPAINSFDNFTHFGTDFGWMGPGQARLESKAGAIRTKSNGEWTGAWHSLSGLAVETQRLFDPTDVIGLGGPPEVRAGVVAVTVDARGQGELRVELSDPGKMVKWSQTMILQPGERTRHRFELSAADLGPVKFFNWVAEPGSSVEVSAIGFDVAKPAISDEEWLMRVSLGKLRRCHDPEGGLTRDRAHLPAGTFDSISSSGMHALASAAGAAEGWLDREMVAGEIRRSTRALLGMNKAAGFLPHFTRRDATGNPVVHPGTEYSTVDTAIALISLRLAGDILGLDDVQDAISALISDLDFDLASTADGWISHGFATDGTTPLASQWRDWGGETALVLMLEAMVAGREPRGKMNPGGQVFRGVQFISEIQSLFYPDFDRETPDLPTGTVWPAARRDLLERQSRYVVKYWPDSPAAQAGIFGLSGGEGGMPGDGYEAYGVDTPGIRWLHPHAMLMSLALSGGSRYSEGVRHMIQAGLVTPQGLPENVEIGLSKHNPMQGSLNAGFEAIAAYHGLRRAGNDVIDESSRRDPLLRTGVRRFYAD
ncbi:hypothetical protein OKA05_13510 [Luteolibacter arcticus]|uniref:Uncharacterized protein n=1 Tax=Luteolibacter arcticus TaxID=1581411 RepID=A0ABT3GJC2_9BACT|nr:hypothetical protein [Luteolibacter arcticus]MCW1923576.1 hypothetical protein [Luteolibacter arcticus]